MNGNILGSLKGDLNRSNFFSVDNKSSRGFNK